MERSLMIAKLLYLWLPFLLTIAEENDRIKDDILRQGENFWIKISSFLIEQQIGGSDLERYGDTGSVF